MNRPWLLLVLVSLTGAVLTVGFWLNSGYGEVSPKAYQYSKALYSACLNKNKDHLSKIEAMVSDSEELPARERRWLSEIIERAHRDDWDSASKEARRILEDQVEY